MVRRHIYVKNESGTYLKRDARNRDVAGSENAYAMAAPLCISRAEK
jgi:hypothetical protein